MGRRCRPWNSSSILSVVCLNVTALLCAGSQSIAEMMYGGQLLSATEKLASKAKGIYKPEWTKYALSIRQSLLSPYPDQDPIVRSDGTWSYLYFQENIDPNARDLAY